MWPTRWRAPSGRRRWPASRRPSSARRRGSGCRPVRSEDTPHNGQQSALAVDAIALLDALGVDEAIVAGFDWGARTANVMAALWPERCRAMVSVSGYLIGSQQAGQAPLPPDAERAWWYQYYFATERGRVGYQAYRRDFARLIWHTLLRMGGLLDSRREVPAVPDNIVLIMRFHPVGGEDVTVVSEDFGGEREALEAIAQALDDRRSLVLTQAASRITSPAAPAPQVTHARLTQRPRRGVSAPGGALTPSLRLTERTGP